MDVRILERDGVRVLREKCGTCIFRPGNLMALRPGRRKDMVDTATGNDGYIPCHETLTLDKEAVCRGAWDVLDTTPLQLARRLNFIHWVDTPTEGHPT